MCWFAFNVLFGKKSDYNVLYCCVGKVLCMHIFNKEFRVLRKKNLTHGSLMVQDHDFFTHQMYRNFSLPPTLFRFS